jgi:hypothetical protein
MSSVLGRTALASLLALTASAGAAAQTLEILASPLGSAAKGLPLPPGATASIKISVSNKGPRAVGPLVLMAKPEGVATLVTQGWRAASGGLTGEIARIAPGERAERMLRLKVERAPLLPAKQRLRIEARSADGRTVAADVELSVADCAGAYREKLAVLRSGLLQKVRDAATDLHRPDLSLPAGRLFPASGARFGDLASAERFAATFALRRGGDPQMATEWFQFLIQRWTSELNAYSNQSAAPGLCANNYYQIAGYRQGLMPITNRIDSVHAAANRALGFARETAKAESQDEDLATLARRATKNFGLAASVPEGDVGGPLAALAGATEAVVRGKLDPDAARTLSLVETAAWLAETDRRGRKLVQAIEEVLAAIATAHKESCVCAF